jgi:hypothetical protein
MISGKMIVKLDRIFTSRWHHYSSDSTSTTIRKMYARNFVKLLCTLEVL